MRYISNDTKIFDIVRAVTKKKIDFFILKITMLRSKSDFGRYRFIASYIARDLEI